MQREVPTPFLLSMKSDDEPAIDTSMMCSFIHEVYYRTIPSIARKLKEQLEAPILLSKFCSSSDACMNDVDNHWQFTRLLICTLMAMAMQIYQSFTRRMAGQALWWSESTGATVAVKVDLQHWFSVSR